tara:strand:+ start:4404 stop:4610 length:207 start_codon:yes stop_codon:yes gene_type:complete
MAVSLTKKIALVEEVANRVNEDNSKRLRKYLAKLEEMVKTGVNPNDEWVEALMTLSHIFLEELEGEEE